MCTQNSECGEGRKCVNGTCVPDEGLPHPPGVPIKPKPASSEETTESEDDQES